MEFLLHLLELVATTPTEKAELAVGRVVIKWVKWGLAYFESLEGQSDVSAIVELARDFGATLSVKAEIPHVTLPATATRVETSYAGSGGKSIYIGMNAVR